MWFILNGQHLACKQARIISYVHVRLFNFNFNLTEDQTRTVNTNEVFLFVLAR